MGSSDKNSEYRNIILISQVGICVMIPMFLCMALGIWLDKKFGTYFTLPLLVVGIAAGARNAYVLVDDVIERNLRALYCGCFFFVYRCVHRLDFSVIVAFVVHAVAKKNHR